MKQKFYYGWFVTFLSGFGIACSFAVLIPSTLGFLVAPLHREFGWTIQQIMSATVFVTAAGVVVSPFVGAIIDRYGARNVIVLSFVLEALIIGSMARMTDSLPLFYARFVAFAVLCSGCTAIGFTTVVSKWFDRKRGLALGIALAGTGLGGVLWSFAVSILFAVIGWRSSLTWFAVFLGIIVAPLMYFILRNDPSDMNLVPDGDSGTAVVREREPLSGMTLREAARTGQFWLLLAVSFLVAFGVQSIMFNLVPIIKQSGDPHHLAGAIQASLWASLVVGRVVTGYLLDKIFAARVAMAFLLFPAAGAALFAAGTTGPTAFVAAMLIGLAAGAEVDTFAYMASRYFGLKYFSRIYGTCFSLFALGAGTGPVITAHIAQQAGSYAPALWMLVGVLALAALTLMFFRRYPAPNELAKKSAEFSVSDQPAT